MERGRIAVAVAGCALAVVVWAAMVLLPGPARTPIVLAAVAGQVALLVARSVSDRRAGRPVDGVTRAPQFALVASGQAGLSHLWAGDDSVVSAVVFVLVGLGFAAVVTVALVLSDRQASEAPSDTRPLPVTAAED